MSYHTELDSISRNEIKVKLDFLNYAAKKN